MQPRDLQKSSFAHYPPEARSLAETYLDELRRIPLSLLPLLLVQIRQYDVSFPAERSRLTAQLETLAKMGQGDFEVLMQPFAAISPPAAIEDLNWINQPQQFSERLTAWLWAEHRIDSYHRAAEFYQSRIEAEAPQPAAVTSRWAFVLVGRGVDRAERPLFRKLAKYGTLFTHVLPENGAEAIMEKAAARAQRFPAPYGHWYIDGGEPLAAPLLTTTAYNRLAPAARREFALMNQFGLRQTGSGLPTVEAITAYLASLTPEDLGLRGGPLDAALRYFETNILTQGAGCQIFSTTFVQWAARECLRRAQPLTLVARFANRQQAAPLEQMLNRDPLTQVQDPQGSLVDADMGAYYTWINLGRLPGGEQTRFLAWWEDRDLALVVAPSMPRGATSPGNATIQQLLEWME